MLSSRGALTTAVAMVECAAGQNTSSRDLFLLTELEAVWVAVGLVARRHLLEGRAIQLPHFGTFSLVEARLFTDKVHRTRYFVRELRFSVNPRFATTYSIDTAHYPVEKPNAQSTRLPWPEVVESCGVPAHTAAKALKEFFLYIGESLFRKRVLQLTFPGVVTLVLKRERMMLTADWEFQSALFDIDAYRWPAEMKQHGLVLLEARHGTGSGSTVADSRPTSSASRVSWQPTTPTRQEGEAGQGISAAPRPTFVAAAPSGRLFSDIEKQARRQREMREMEKADAEDAARRARELEQRLHHYHAQYRFESAQPQRPATRSAVDARRPDTRGSTASRPGTTESVYHWIEETQTIEPSALVPGQGEPEIETIEVVALSAQASDEDNDEQGQHDADSAPVSSFEPRPMFGKDVELEKLLREEEPFSRPISRKSCAPQSTARDLIYYDPSSDSSAMRPARVAATSSQPPSTEPQTVPPVRFGRKRYDYGMEPQPDNVGRLLKRDD